MDRWMRSAGICSLEAWHSIQLYDWQAKGKGTRVVVAFGRLAHRLGCKAMELVKPRQQQK
jgi:hypothetical protein